MQVEKFLKKAGVEFAKHRHSKAFTAQELAAEEHVSGHSVAKSVAVRADDQCVLCVLPASCRINLLKLAMGLEVQQCQIITEDELAGLFPDVKVGAEPPFGNLYGLPTIVDLRLTQCDVITFSAGSYSKAIRMPYSEYERLAAPRVLDFSAMED